MVLNKFDDFTVFTVLVTYGLSLDHLFKLILFLDENHRVISYVLIWVFKMCQRWVVIKKSEFIH
jgi:hypothetical protein